MPKKVVIPTRNPMPEQPPEVRAHNYEEVTLGYTPEQAMAEAARCLQCVKPVCIRGCPVNINIPGFLQLVEDGDFRGAVNLIKETNVLPAMTGRVCPQESQCEGVCVLCKKFEPVAIGRVERFVADWEAAQGPLPVPQLAPPTGKKVAVVGSGPAGLTVAADLARLGHSITIFEALHESGGVLVYGIPEFRLPKAIVKREVDYVCSLGVHIRNDFIVGSSATVDELLEEYDAVFLGTGAGLPWFLGIPGENLGGVYSANEYLTPRQLDESLSLPGIRYADCAWSAGDHHRRREHRHGRGSNRPAAWGAGIRDRLSALAGRDASPARRNPPRRAGRCEIPSIDHPDCVSW